MHCGIGVECNLDCKVKAKHATEGTPGVKRLLTPASALFRTTEEPNLTEVAEDCDFLFVLLGFFWGGGPQRRHPSNDEVFCDVILSLRCLGVVFLSPCVGHTEGARQNLFFRSSGEGQGAGIRAGPEVKFLLEGAGRVLGPHPADGHPEGLPLQALQDPSQFGAGAGGVLLDEDPVHQVSVLLVDLDGRLTHLLEVLVLEKRRQRGDENLNSGFNSQRIYFAQLSINFVFTGQQH